MPLNGQIVGTWQHTQKRSRYDVGWFVTWLGFRKENPAADCNFKLSFQRDWRWYR